jgi:hypothetical protein
MDVTLRPTRESDLGFLYWLAADVGPAWLRIGGAGLPPLPLFAERLWTSVHTMCTMKGPGDKPVGVASLYRASERDGTCWVEVQTAAGGPVDAEAAERQAMADMLSRAFERCGFRIVYCGYPAWHPPAIPSPWEAVEEARLVEHLFHQGSWWDQVVVAIRSEP